MKTRAITIHVPVFSWLGWWWLGCWTAYVVLFVVARFVLFDVGFWRFITAYVLLAVALSILGLRNDERAELRDSENA